MKGNAVIVSPLRLGDTLETDGAPKIVRVRLSYKSFAAASTLVDLYTLQPDPWTKFPAGITVLGMWISCIQDWKGGVISGSTLAVGSDTQSGHWIGPLSVFAGSPKIIQGNPINPGDMLNTSSPYSTGTVSVRLITTGGNTNLLTQGKADLFMNLQATSLRTV